LAVGGNRCLSCKVMGSRIFQQCHVDELHSVRIYSSQSVTPMAKMAVA
jgi:hypothetical protein